MEWSSLSETLERRDESFDVGGDIEVFGVSGDEPEVKDLGEKYASKPEWKVIEEGGVLSIPVEDDQPLNVKRTL